MNEWMKWRVCQGYIVTEDYAPVAGRTDLSDPHGASPAITTLLDQANTATELYELLSCAALFVPPSDLKDSIAKLTGRIRNSRREPVNAAGMVAEGEAQTERAAQTSAEYIEKLEASLRSHGIRLPTRWPGVWSDDK